MKKKDKKITGSCSPKCWFAEREKCECICEGKNHQLGLSKDKSVVKMVQGMKEKFKEYQKYRKMERKLKRGGLPGKTPAADIMRGIARGVR